MYLHKLALRGFLGDGAPRSARAIQRLTHAWQAQYTTGQQRELATTELVYVWADGIYVKAGLETSKAALLVVIGGVADGTKVVLAGESGQRESAERWAMVRRDLTARGLRAPACVVGDGALGLWGAVAQVWPTAAEPRGWNHKLCHVADAVPLKQQPPVVEVNAEPGDSGSPVFRLYASTITGEPYATAFFMGILWAADAAAGPAHSGGIFGNVSQLMLELGSFQVVP